MTTSIKFRLFLSLSFFFSIANQAIAQIDTNRVEVNIFPNPNSGTFYITLINDEPYISQLFGMDGRLVKTVYLTKGLNYVSVQVPEGVYILKVGEGDVPQQFKVVVTD